MVKLSKSPESSAVIKEPELSTFFRLFGFNFTNIMLNSFSSNVQTLVTEKFDLGKRFIDIFEGEEKKLEKLETYCLKVLLDFCPNSSFNTTILKNMLNLSSTLVRNFQNLENNLMVYLSEVKEFFEFINYFKEEDKQIEIGEFDNHLRKYEKVDHFLDDLVCLICIFWNLSSKTGQNRLSLDTLIQIYTDFKELDFVPEVLRAFTNGRETTKLKVIKSIWETLRIQIIQNCFEIFHLESENPKTSSFKSISAYDKHLRSLLRSDDTECQLTHFCFIHNTIKFLSMWQTIQEPEIDNFLLELSKPIEILNKLCPMVISKIALDSLHTDQGLMSYRRVSADIKIVESLTSFMSNLEGPNEEIFKILKDLLSIVDKNLEMYPQTRIFNSCISIFKSTLIILQKVKPKLKETIKK